MLKSLVNPSSEKFLRLGVIMGRIRKALISVSDKKDIVDFAKKIRGMGIEIISTGGTAKSLRDAGVEVREVSDYTGFPEMLDGRLKTLHPKIHGGLLAKRDNPKHIEDMKSYGMELIDMVVVNLYPFEQTVSKPDVTLEEAIENIDIGGPTMLRAAAKNYDSVAVVIDPSDYEGVIKEMKNNNCELSNRTKCLLARKVFEHTSRYDGLIADYLKGVLKA
jgi:phosphoribosylaminoimidazolecarboxamide formyltransferase/IMP cyclohydrolase